jgi:hypothetical protein
MRTQRGVASIAATGHSYALGVCSMELALNRRQWLVSGGAAVLGAGGAGLAAAPGEQGVEFVPSYELERGAWLYQSFLLQPTDPDVLNGTGSLVSVRRWAIGELRLQDGPGLCEARGILDLGNGRTLQVAVTGAPGGGLSPAAFEAIGEGVEGPLAGARYLLRGFAIRGNDGRLNRVHGSVFVIAGTKDRPDFEPGGMPVGTAGTFMITKPVL